MALRDVNLIPFEISYRRILKRHLFLWACALLACLVVIAGIYLYQMHIHPTVQSPSQKLRETYAHTGTLMAQIKKLEDELAQLDKQQAFIANLNQNPAYAWLISKLSDMMNDQIWLTHLYMESKGGKPASVQMKLTGLAYSNEHLGNFLNNLSKEPVFKTSRLKYVKETSRRMPERSEALKLVIFEIDCTL